MVRQLRELFSLGDPTSRSFLPSEEAVLSWYQELLLGGAIPTQAVQGWHLQALAPRGGSSVWFLIVTTLHVEDMLVPPRPPLRCFRRGSFAPLSSRTPTLMFVHVIIVKEWATGLKRMKCPSTSSLKLRSLMFGASTSWDPFHSPEVISTYWLLWIMYPSGWR